MTSSNPIQPVGVDHVVFLVRDMAASLAFYEGVLNCRPGFSYPALGMEQVWFGSDLIVLWDITHPGARDAVPPIDGGRNVDHVCLACGPFAHDALRDHLQRHGVAITREARHGGARGMGASFYVSDPDGNRIEIKGPPEHPDLPAAHG